VTVCAAENYLVASVNDSLTRDRTARSVMLVTDCPSPAAPNVNPGIRLWVSRLSGKRLRLHLKVARSADRGRLTKGPFRRAQFLLLRLLNGYFDAAFEKVQILIADQSRILASSLMKKTGPNREAGASLAATTARTRDSHAVTHFYEDRATVFQRKTRRVGSQPDYW
jgi:hypothetical protein